MSLFGTSPFLKYHISFHASYNKSCSLRLCLLLPFRNTNAVVVTLLAGDDEGVELRFETVMRELVLKICAMDGEIEGFGGVIFEGGCVATETDFRILPPKFLFGIPTASKSK